MVLFWISLVLALSGSNAEGQFRILHSPDSLKFKPTDFATWESMLKEIFAAALGLSVAYDSEWDGLQIMDPFNTPEAAVNVHIDGVSGLEANFGLKPEIFPLLVDEYEPDTFKGVKLRIKQRFDVGSNELVNFELSNVTKFNRIKSSFGKVDAASYKMVHRTKFIYLKQEVMEDRLFLKELRTLRAVIEKVEDGVLSADKLIDFYNFRFRTLHTLSDYYGPFSNKTKEAKQLLGDALQDLSIAFVKAYNGSVLVTVVTTEVSHSRRSARAVTTKSLAHSKKWPYKWPQLNQEKKSKEAQTGGRQESDVEGHRGYSSGYFKSSINSPEESSTEPLGFVADGEFVAPRGEFVAPERRFVVPEEDSTTTTTEASKAEETVLRQGGEEGGGGSGDDVPVVSVNGGGQEPPLPHDNAAIFNLFLHLGMAWFFAMLAIVYFIMEMDPGRDTIIYRMTATRSTKKDV